MFVGRGGEGARDLFGRSKVSSSARASQAAFFACEIWNLQVPQLSSAVGPTHHLNRLSVRLRTSLGTSNNAEISDQWDRTADESRHSYRAGCQIAIRMPSPGPTPQSCSAAIPYLCNALLPRQTHSGAGFTGIMPNVKGPRKACSDCTVNVGPQIVRWLFPRRCSSWNRRMSVTFRQACVTGFRLPC